MTGSAPVSAYETHTLDKAVERVLAAGADRDWLIKELVGSVKYGDSPLAVALWLTKRANLLEAEARS